MRSLVGVVCLGLIVAGAVYLQADAGGQAVHEPVRVGGNVPAPRKTKDVAPVYPAAAQRDGVQGIVIVEATIGEDGRVSRARVVRSIEGLDRAAVEAVEQWEFAPTLLNGAPVPVIMTVTVNFSLRSGTAAATEPSGRSQEQAGDTAPGLDSPQCPPLADTSEEAAHRDAAIGFIRDLHEKERTVLIARQGKGYAPIEALPGMSPPNGFDVQLVAADPAYSVSLKDTAHVCGPAFFSDQRGVIYLAIAIR